MFTFGGGGGEAQIYVDFVVRHPITNIMDNTYLLHMFQME